MSGPDKSYKLLFLGDQAVGKTSILLRFINGTFSGSDISTIGIDYKIKNIEYQGMQIELNIWDSAGQERFRALTKNYFKGANSFIFVYDITKKSSYDNLKNWIIEAQQSANLKGYQILIVGNKLDLKEYRVVKELDGETFAKKYKAKYIETSAKSGENIEGIFIAIVEELIKGEKEKEPDDWQNKARANSQKLNISNKNINETSECKC